MAFLVIKLLSLICLIGLTSSAPSSSQRQKQILEKWFREFNEISATFDKDVVAQFAAEKGFHVKATSISTTISTTTTTTTSTTPKPNQRISIPLSSGLEREDDGLSPILSAFRNAAFGPMRVRFMMRTSSFPGIESLSEDITATESPAPEEVQTTGTVKKDNPLDQSFEDMAMSRLLRRLILPDKDEEGTEGDHMDMIGGFKRLEDMISSGFPASAPAVESQEWMSESVEKPAKTASPSSTTTTSTTTTATTSEGAPTTESVDDDYKNWNPFTKQGFRRIFRFVF